MPETYLTVDYTMGQTPQDLTAMFNIYGAQGWQIRAIEIAKYNERRVEFMQRSGSIEYLVIDYDAGKPAEILTDDLNGYGVDGWQLSEVDLARHNLRRAILMRGPGLDGGTGGGIEEAPLNDQTYGRRNATWNLAIAADNDVIDGGSF
jgi:hypothetical protein